MRILGYRLFEQMVPCLNCFACSIIKMYELIIIIFQLQQATSIHWNYKVTDDIVKVEVWDVVDKGKKRVLTDNLKIEQTTVQQQPPLTTSLDAEFIDVYKGTNGVILVMDITKAW